MDSWAVAKLLSLDRKLAFTSMLGSDWHMSKQNVYNWPSNKSDLRSHHDRLASSRPSHAIRKSIGINSGPRITTTARPPWYTCDRPPTDLWYFATDPRLGRDCLELPVCLGKRLREIKISRVTCDWFTIVQNDILGQRVIYHQPVKTCEQRRIQLRVGSLASEIDKFHDHFWQLKVVVELVNFNGE